MIKVDLQHRIVHEYCHVLQTFVVNRLESGRFEVGTYSDASENNRISAGVY
jgi:hypothetical protein